MLSNACPKPTPRVLTKLQRRAEEAKQLRETWAAVDLRDDYSCRVCKKFCNPRAITLLEKIHRHHLQYRSHGRLDTVENLVSLCSKCHGLVHAAQLRLSGDANVRDAVTGKLCGVVVERLVEGGWTIEKCC